MAVSVSQIRIKAQPQGTYRERYYSESDPRRKRAQRFIRADANPDRYEYPTIEIPEQWHDKPNLYIRITPITILSDLVNDICIHPYPIDTSERDVIRDPERNTLFFPVTEDNCKTSSKSFRITRKKLIQYELRNYGQLRLLNTDERDIQRLSDPTDARKLIEFYQLGKSQLVFSFAELLHENRLPIIYDATTVYSHVMTAVAPTNTTNSDELAVRCVPHRGFWHGGDEVLMVIPKIDKRKTCKVMFDHPFMENLDEIPVNFVDMKTIAFVTPPCPLSIPENRQIQIPLVVLQGNEEIARVNFYYQLIDRCLTCNANLTFDSSDESNTYEYSQTMDMSFDHSAF